MMPTRQDQSQPRTISERVTRLRSRLATLQEAQRLTPTERALVDVFKGVLDLLDDEL